MNDGLQYFMLLDFSLSQNALDLHSESNSKTSYFIVEMLCKFPTNVNRV
jgi:hypothetical protein